MLQYTYMNRTIPALSSTCLQEGVTGRVLSSLSEVNVLNYEGTALDQLLFDIIDRAGLGSRLTVLCSTRPCMSRRLQESVRVTALANKWNIVTHSHDCDIRDEKFIRTECQHVSSALSAIFHAKQGTQIISSLVSNRTLDALADHSISNDSLPWNPPCSFLPNYTGRHWTIIAPFSGFSIASILTDFVARFKRLPERWEVPLCYLPCYNEKELGLFLDLTDAFSAILALPANI